MATATTVIQANILKVLRQPSDSDLLLDRALEWLKDAIEDAQMFLPEAEFFQMSEMPLTLVVSQATYALPSDMLQLMQVRNNDESVIINMLSRDEFDRRHPSSEDDATPNDGTLEYDRNNNRHILRLAPPPVAADTLYAIMRRWHPTLSDSQNIQYDKLEKALERRAIYYGSVEVFNDNEFTNYRAELKNISVEKFNALQRVVAIQKPHRTQVPTILRKSGY